jgi:hypothetical protein
MKIGTLIKFKDTTEIGIVTSRVPNEFNRWEVIGLINHVGFRYELTFPNKHVEILE